MQKITFTNANNQSITLKDTFPRLLQNLQGIGAPSVSPLTQRGFQQDGLSHFGNLLDHRVISFRAVISDNDREQLLVMREEIFKVFNPSLGSGVLNYGNGTSNYTINCCVYDGPTEVLGVSTRNAVMQSFDIGILCPRPAWEIVQDDVEMVGFTGGVEFGPGPPEGIELDNPFILIGGEDEGLTLGTQGDYAQIEYSGTLSAPLLIEFRGPAVLPKITKVETGEFLEVALELLEGEKLFIDTQPDTIDVYKIDGDGVKTSAFGYINPLSTYFLLNAGTNSLTFSVSSGDPVVYLHYAEHYVGV